MSDRKHNSAFDSFFDCRPNTFDFGRSSDDTYADSFSITVITHEPIFGHGKILGSIDFLK